MIHGEPPAFSTKDGTTSALPIHDRLRVVQSLWDSIPADSPVEVSPEQRAELQRRIAAHEQSPEQLLTWDEVLDRLRDSR